MEAKTVSSALDLDDPVSDGLDSIHLLTEIFSLHGLGRAPPLHGAGLGDILEDDPSTTFGLVFHQFDAVFAFFLRLAHEVGTKAVESLVMAVEVGAHGEIHIGGV